MVLFDYDVVLFVVKEVVFIDFDSKFGIVGVVVCDV